MESWWRWQWQWMMAVVVAGAILRPAASDPEINLLNKGCSQYNASNILDFYNNRNATFADLRQQISQQNKLFATAQQSRSSDPVYAMVQCRNYLSPADCLACYDAAVLQIKNCSAANGARVIYDGCYLRYESNSFYDQTTLPGNTQICGNITASQPSAFQSDAEAFLKELEVATPRINGFFAASKKQVNGGGSFYAVAQCAETVSQSGCQDCLTVAYRNIQGCLPNADGRSIDAACFMRYSETAFFADNQTTDILPLLGGGGSSKTKAIIGGVVGGAAGLMLIILALFFWHRSLKRTKEVRKANILGATELQAPVLYNYKDLKSATNDFHEENKLGEGGFGEVYKGTLQNGHVVAIKKLTLSSGRAKTEFDSEVILISNVHHRNLVRLLGCAKKGAELILVHEYMANGSLDTFLYGDRKGMLNWKQRFDIIFGVARGLAYLHEQFHVCIIHRDIKPSNILLDQDFQAKIADFGLAKLMPQDRSHLSTKFAGTLGYTAPEYALHGHLSEKVDAYSFGIVVLEIVSGRKSNDVQVEPISEYLLQQAWKLHENDMHLKLVDATLDPSGYDAEEVKRVIKIALLCTQSESASRPTMSEVIVMLLSDRSTDRTITIRSSGDPDRRFFADSSLTFGTESSTSNASVSFTEFTGR